MEQSEIIKHDPSQWATNAAKRLRCEAAEIEACGAPTYLGCEHLKFANLLSSADQAVANLTPTELIERDRCIYVITIDGETDHQQLLKRFRAEKSSTNLKLPQDNGTSDRAGQMVLYVGSSCATGKRKHTLKKRLTQHLKSAPSGTYALSLAAWATKLEGGVFVEAWQYPTMGEGLEADRRARSIVLSIEDALSEQLAPLLGRRGIRK